jgi:hypothetical protein
LFFEIYNPVKADALHTTVEELRGQLSSAQKELFDKDVDMKQVTRVAHF